MRLRRQDDDELRRVYREHVDAVFGFFAYSLDRQQAEDLTATTFERVIRHWRRFDPQRASERTWILVIARNTLIDHHRRQQLRRGTSLDQHPALAESLTAPGDAIAELLDSDAFAGWLTALGEREREVLAMRYAADMTAREVADALELSEANVHQIASRAIKKLRGLAEGAG